VDTTPPSITPPADVEVEQASADGTAVVLGTPTVSDICDADVTVTNDAPALFPLGVTTVTWTATDDSGNSAQATQTVRVVDTTPPTITPPADVEVEQASADGTAVDLGTPTVSDICDADVTVTNDAPALFPLGVTTVTWTATDDSGNSAQATQRVTVTPGEEVTVVLLAPNGGEVFAGGGGTDITWAGAAAEPDATVTLDVTTDGTEWVTIASGLPDTGSYHWEPIPNENSSACRIRATVVDGGSDSDTSDADFTIDSTPPALDIQSVKQDGVGLLGGPVAVRGLVEVQVAAADSLSGLAAPPTVTLIYSDDTSEQATLVGEGPAGVFNYAAVITGTTPNGPCTVAANAEDRAGNQAAAGAKQFTVNVNALTATIELEDYVGSPGAVLTFRFAFTDAGGSVLEERAVDIPFTNHRATEQVILDDVPEGAVAVSCKELDHFLRRRVDIGGTAPDLTAEFTGQNKLLGGDYNDDNVVDVHDLAQFMGDNGRDDRPESDINGDGVVGILDFLYISTHFYQSGDDE